MVEWWLDSLTIYRRMAAYYGNQIGERVAVLHGLCVRDVDRFRHRQTGFELRRERFRRHLGRNGKSLVLAGAAQTESLSDAATIYRAVDDKQIDPRQYLCPQRT